MRPGAILEVWAGEVTTTMTRSTTINHTGVSLILSSLILASGCVLENEDDVDEFREAVPAASSVRLTGPDESSAGSGERSSGLQSTGDSASIGEYAKYYAFTRHVRGAVNAVTAHVLGSVWFIVHTKPTEVHDAEAIWGPGTDDLSPVTYRFRVIRVAQDTYEYVLEGRPRASQSDADFVPVLQGEGYGRAHPKHGDGFFTVDMDAAHALDPIGSPDRGTLRVDHDLPAALSSDLSQSVPRDIRAVVENDAGSYSIETHQEAAGGSLRVEAHGDLDEANATLPEDVTVESQWLASGAGRSDITIAGGDIPVSVGSVTAVECWGTDFKRAYYDDSIDWEPTQGDASACVLAAPVQFESKL